MTRRTAWLGLTLTLTMIIIGSACSTTPESPDPASIARGGTLYDNWWLATEGASQPTADQALWSTQSSNTLSGADTWRCRECHGWDYQGAAGAYADGPHRTGFPGVLDAGGSNGTAELVSILRGGDNADHDFSSVLSDEALEDLANFLSAGVIDERRLIDYDTKEVIGADRSNGVRLFVESCSTCHGADGRKIDFGDGDGIGDRAYADPWKVLHKIRFGHPGTPMPRAVQLGRTVDQAVDILGHVQSLHAE